MTHINTIKNRLLLSLLPVMGFLVGKLHPYEVFSFEFETVAFISNLACALAIAYSIVFIERFLRKQ